MDDTNYVVMKHVASFIVILQRIQEIEQAINKNIAPMIMMYGAADRSIRNMSIGRVTRRIVWSNVEYLTTI